MLYGLRLGGCMVGGGGKYEGGALGTGGYK